MNANLQKTRSRLLWSGAAALTLLVIWGGLPWVDNSVSSQVAVRPVTPRGELDADERNMIDLFQRERESVVFITTTERVLDRWTRNVLSIPRGSGSGFFWDEEGHIVTNYHVIAEGSGARVRLSDGSEVAASLVGASPAHDLAVLRIELDHIPNPVPLGTSGDLQVGQKVFAIGNPFGLDWTLTSGIVSALDRSLPAADDRNLIEHLIQTDAAINPGNSGGPLLDSAGRLIGVATAIYSPSGAYAGVGFAVPADTVARVVPQLIATGRYVRPTLGIEVDEGLNRLITRNLGRNGVVVLRITPGSPAAEAGLVGSRIDRRGNVTPGDIILAVDGQPIESVARLLSRLDDYRVGDTVNLTILRDRQEQELSVTLQAGQ